MPGMPSNFSVLAPLSPELAKIGHMAETYFCSDPNTALLKLRQFGELLAQELAARFGLRDVGTSESQLDLLKRLD